MFEREDINFYLQYSDLNELQKLCEKITQETKLEILQNPITQTLLVPIYDPISKGEFYGGETLVTSSYVCLEKDKQKNQGWSMVLDDNEAYSLNIAIIDAYFSLINADAKLKEEILILLEKAKRKKEDEEAKINQQVASTRVNFELM